MRMMLNRRDNGEDGKAENTQGRPDSSYSLQELLIFPQPMMQSITFQRGLKETLQPFPFPLKKSKLYSA